MLKTGSVKPYKSYDLCGAVENIGSSDKLLCIYMGIDVGGDPDIGMPHEALRCPDVNACLLEIRAVGVTQIIWDKVICQGKRRDQLVPVEPATHGDIHITAQAFHQALVGRF